MSKPNFGGSRIAIGPPNHQEYVDHINQRWFKYPMSLLDLAYILKKRERRHKDLICVLRKSSHVHVHTMCRLPERLWWWVPSVTCSAPGQGSDFHTLSWLLWASLHDRVKMYVHLENWNSLQMYHFHFLLLTYCCHCFGEFNVLNVLQTLSEGQ